MCFSKPAQQQNQTTSQSGTTSQNVAQTQTQSPNPITLAAYMDFINRALGVSQTPFDPNTLAQTAPWTDALNSAVNYQWGLGQQGMQFVPQAAAMIGQGGQPMTAQSIGDMRSSMMSPYVGQLADYGQQALDWGKQYGQQAADWGTSKGTGIADYAEALRAAAPQFQQFSKQAVDQYLSPYIQDVVDASQAQFNNQNAIQSSALLGQGIRAGNAFGGDRAGVAQGILAGQQQLAQAPVIANLYNQGYAQALQEYNIQNQLAAQMSQLGLQGQIAGGQLGLQGLTAGGQLGLQGMGLGLQGLGLAQQGYQTANQQALAALGQNQQAALSAGQLFGNLGATQFGQNLQGGQQAIGAAGIYPQYIQQLLNTQQQNALAQAGYPFQTTSWYGGLLGGIGPLTGQIGTGQLSGTTLSNLIGNSQITQPSNTLNNILGLGLTGLKFLSGLPGLGLERGGVVPHRAEGGDVEPYSSAPSYVPRSRLPKGMTDRLPSSRMEGPKEDRPINFSSKWLGEGDSIGRTAKSSSARGTEAGKALSDILGWFSGGDRNSGLSTAQQLMRSGWGAEDFPEGASPFERGGIVDMHYRNGGYYADGYDVEDDDEDEEIPETARYTAGERTASLGPAYSGRGSWYSQLPQRGWVDRGDRPNSNALGVPDEQQGIALPSRQTLGQWFDVTFPNGRTERLQQTDVGPAPWTGRGIDISAAAADRAGYTPRTFQTDATYRWSPADGAAALPSRDQQAVLAREGGISPRLIADLSQFRTPRPQRTWRDVINDLGTIGTEMIGTQGFTGVRRGFQRVEQQREAEAEQARLDEKPVIDNSGEFVRMRMGNKWIEFPELPTGNALREAGAERRHQERLAAQKEQKAPRTAAQAAFQKFMEENPNATADDIAAFNARLNTRQGQGLKLPAGVQKNLGEAGTTMDQLDNLSRGFKPDYGGFGAAWVGDLANMAALRGWSTDQRKQAAEWWQTYDRYKADIRHSKFGATLTGNEKQAWDKLDVNPGMDPDSIRKNMEAQQRIVEGAAMRSIRSLAAQGYSKEAIEAQLGVSLDELLGRRAPKETPVEKPAVPETAAGGPKEGQRQPLPPELAAQAKEAIKTKGRDAVIKRLQERGYDTSGL